MTKLITILIITLSLSSTFFAQAPLDKRAEKAREFVTKIGVDPNTKIDVKLTNSTKLRGYISAVSTESFSLTDVKTGAARNILFANVDKISRPGKFGVGSWIAIGALATAGVILSALLIQQCRNEMGCGAGR